MLFIRMMDLIGVAGDAGDSNMVYEVGVGWCSSGLDEPALALLDKKFFTLEECWNVCVDDHGADVIHNVEVSRCGLRCLTSG